MVAVAEQFYPLGLAIVHDAKRVLDHRQGGAHEEHLQHNRQHKHSLPVFVHRARVRVVLVSSIYFTLSDGGTVRISDGNACGACTHHRTCTVYGSVPRGSHSIPATRYTYICASVSRPLLPTRYSAPPDGDDGLDDGDEAKARMPKPA